MMKKYVVLLVILACHSLFVKAQQKSFTMEDSLRGTLGEGRTWWDLLHYEIGLKPDYGNLSITGSNKITFKTIAGNQPGYLQLDLQEPMKVDSVLFKNKALKINKKGRNAWMVYFTEKFNAGDTLAIQVFFSGKPRRAIKAPWDGGFIFDKDKEGRRWMTIACQGIGASVWLPCKDHQEDEPDMGVVQHITVDAALTAVANGRLTGVKDEQNGTKTYSWKVESPINNYSIIPYIGHYINNGETYQGENGKLDMNYWVLDYNADKIDYLKTDARRTIKALEYWFGPYPFYKDGYQLIEAPHLGMEHQSAVAYGNQFKPGYLGRDLSGSGWGKKFDFITVHESGHEWFGNNITSKDVADMWIHESFTCYSETLFLDFFYGNQAGNEYNQGIRKNIANDEPVIGAYGVNSRGSGSDMYYKGANMLHTIRHSVNNDSLFRKMLRDMGQVYYHKTVTTTEVEQFMNAKLDTDFSTVFTQYLRTTQVPELEFYTKKGKIYFRYTNCVKGFNLPLTLSIPGVENKTIRITPKESWQNVKTFDKSELYFNKENIEKMYYLKVKNIKSK